MKAVRRYGKLVIPVYFNANFTLTRPPCQGRAANLPFNLPSFPSKVSHQKDQLCSEVNPRRTIEFSYNRVARPTVICGGIDFASKRSGEECRAMPRLDTDHAAVKASLINAGWIITHDPLTLENGRRNLFVDWGPKPKRPSARRRKATRLRSRSIVPELRRTCRNGNVASARTFFTASFLSTGAMTSTQSGLTRRSL